MQNYSSKKKDLIALRTGERIPKQTNWNDTQDTILVSMYQSGVGLSEIALYLNRSESAVVHRLMSKSILTPPGLRRRPYKKSSKCRCSQCTQTTCPHYGDDAECCVVV